MSYFPREEKDIFYAIDQSFKCYWPVFKRIVPWAFCLTLIEGISTYSNLYLVNDVFYWICLLLESFAFLFVLGAMLYQANSILEEKPVTFKEACLMVCRRLGSMYMVFVLFIAIIISYCVLFFHIMHRLGEHAHSQPLLANIFLLFALALLMVFIVFFLFTLPLIVLEGLSALNAIKQAYQLSKSHPVLIFTVYASISIVAVVVFPATQHAHFFMRYHVWLLFDFIMYCLLLPFVLNYMLFLLNDLRTRLQ